MAATTNRLDGLSEVTELERIPLPYKTLYHTLVFKTEMPIELLKERHQTGSAQLLTWIKAASTLVQTIVDSQQQQRQKQREAVGKNQTKSATTTTAPTTTTTESTEKEEENEDDLQEEIQDVVSGFGQYEPTIESSIEILLQLEECITERTSNPSTTLSNAVATGQHQHLSAEIETILEQWSRLRCIIGELTGSVREHQRLRDGIQSIDSIWEQTRQAIGILDRCVEAIEQDKRRTSQLEKAQSPTPGTPVPEGSGNHSPSSPRPLAVDSNDMLELESRIGLLGLQISTLQKSFPECTRSPKSSKALIKSRAKNSKVIDREPYSISDKKYHMATLYRGLLADWNSLRSRKDQLWHDLEECDRWRTRVEKMALQIETMLEPVEIFYKLCVNLLESLDSADQNDPTITDAGEMTPTDSVQDLAVAIAASSTSVNEKSRSVDADAIDMETLWSTLQELEEKQTTVAPAIENMFWVQDGEFQTRSAGAAVPASPTAAAAPPSPSSVSELSAAVGPERSPLYPSLEMVERHRHLKDRWSNLKLSLGNVGTNLQGHHTRMKDQATETRIKKGEMTSEDKTLVGNSTDSSPSMRRNTTSGPSKSVTMPPWNSSTRILRGKLVPSMSMDSNVVRKFMLVKSEKPVWAKPRPWCPSARTSSPGMPGFPQQTATWGYYLISKSQSMDSVGRVIAAPAPPLVPRLTLPPPSKISPQTSPKDKRPPFLPGGGSRSQSFNKQVPPPPVKTSFHTRSFSVAGGELGGSNRGDKKGSSRTPKTGSGSKSNPTSPTDTSNGPFGPQGANATNKRGNGSNRTGASRHKSSASQQGHHGSGHGASHSQGGHSKGSHHNSLWRHTLDHLHQQDSSSASASSSEDDTIDGLGLMKGIRHASFNKHKHPAMNTSTSSLDSMLSSCNSSSFGASRGGLRHYESSSVSSSHGARSPSPYTPAFFGSSMAAARSTAALHTALLTSMTTSSPSSRCSSAYSARSESRVEEQRQQQRISDAVAATSASASTWMSMNAGSLISALSFSVPTYSNFDEDFGSFASLEETVATM